MNATTGLTLLFPSVLKFIGVWACALIGLGALVGVSKLPQPSAFHLKLSLGAVALTCSALSLALAVWSDGLTFLQTKGMRFDQLCTSASLVIHKRIDGAKGVLLDHTGIVDTYKHTDGVTSPNLFLLLSIAKIDYVDVLNRSDTTGEESYFRYSKDQNTAAEKVATSDAKFVIHLATIVNPGDIAAGVYGQRMSLLERTTGESLGVFSYYWTQEAYCPKAKQQGLHTTQIAAYILGLRDSKDESVMREAFLP